jgi:hypothetical protein
MAKDHNFELGGRARHTGIREIDDHNHLAVLVLLLSRWDDVLESPNDVR